MEKINKLKVLISIVVNVCCALAFKVLGVSWLVNFPKLHISFIRYIWFGIYICQVLYSLHSLLDRV